MLLDLSYKAIQMTAQGLDIIQKESLPSIQLSGRDTDTLLVLLLLLLLLLLLWWCLFEYLSGSIRVHWLKHLPNNQNRKYTKQRKMGTEWHWTWVGVLIFVIKSCFFTGLACVMAYGSEGHPCLSVSKDGLWCQM